MERFAQMPGKKITHQVGIFEILHAEPFFLACIQKKTKKNTQNFTPSWGALSDSGGSILPLKKKKIQFFFNSGIKCNTSISMI